MGVGKRREGLSKSQPAFLQAYELVAGANHHVIEHVDLEQLAGLYDFARHRHIFYIYVENVVWESLTF
jgi:hypothetical protein